MSVQEQLAKPLPKATKPRRRQAGSSLVGRLGVLIAIFVSVPLILYTQFLTADRDQQTLLLTSVHEQGRLIAEALRPTLIQAGIAKPPALGDALERLAGEETTVKLLFRPAAGADSAGFFFVASAPPVAIDLLDAERDRLVELGVLEKLTESCEVAQPPEGATQPSALRYTTPAGDEQIVTSVAPVHTVAGCWAVVVAHSTAAYDRSSIGRPYWMTPQIRVAAIIYVVMAVLIITVFLGLWRSLRRFAHLARDIRTRGPGGRTFVSQNRVREFAGVAAELDRLVVTLEESSRLIRQAAEENAHAFKTPIAVISQSLEPLKRLVPDDNVRGRRALSMIEKSVEKLDDFITCARRMDEVVADLIDPPRNKVNLSVLLGRVAAGYATIFAARGLSLELEVEDNALVRASEDLLETVIENLIENAVSFSPPGAAVAVTLRKTPATVEMSVEDNGPGAPAGDLERIFERYYSRRPMPPEPDGDDETGAGDPRHFGIGLWIVRRNVEAIGGKARAERGANSGLRVCITLPLIR
jgi:two-component system sensor histidine kinase ChvG